MPSPFSKYTGEQIQPINYLPYTGEMARQRYESISNLGKGIAEGIKNYRQASDERENLAEVAKGVIGEFVTQDFQNPEDKATFIPKADAPIHHQDLIKEALKAGDGDIGAGLSAMPISKLRAWTTLHTKYISDVRLEAENALKREGIQVQKDDLAFREKTAEAQNQYNKDLLTLKQKEHELARKQHQQNLREKKKTEAIKNLTSEVDNENVSPYGTLIKEVTVRQKVGDIFDEDGNLIVQNVDIEDAIEALNLPRDKVLSKEDYNKSIFNRQEDLQNYAATQVGVYFSGSEQFSLKDDFTDAVQKGYAEKFIRNAFRQANALSLKLYKEELKGVGNYFPDGLDGRLVNANAAYKLATKFASQPNMIEEAKFQGIKTVPENIAFDKLYIKSVDSEGDIIKQEKIQVPLTELALFKARYDSLAAKSPNGKLPVSFQTLVEMNPSRFIRQIQVQLPDGTVQNVFRNGDKLVPVSSIFSSGDSNLTAAKIDYQAQDNWMKIHTKPKVYGNLTIQTKGGAETFAGHWNTDYPKIVEGLSDIRQIHGIAQEMRQFVGKGMISKILDVEGMKRFSDLVARAKTYRRNFIAGGQETEQDNIRLANIVGEFDLQRLVFKDVHMKAIDAFEQIIQDKVVDTLRNSNIAVQIGQRPRFTAKEIRQIADELEKK